MAPKRAMPFDYPPSASSSDEEEIASDDELVASDEEVEEKVSHAEEEEDDEEEEEDDEEMTVPKPVAQRESPNSDEAGDDISVVMKNDEVSDSEMDDTESDDTTMNHLIRLLSKVASGFGISEEYLRNGLSLIGKTERVKMAKQWEKLLIDENELMLKRLELHMEAVKLALDALGASSH